MRARVGLDPALHRVDGAVMRPRVVKMYGLDRSRCGVVLAVTPTVYARPLVADWALPSDQTRPTASDSAVVITKLFMATPSRTWRKCGWGAQMYEPEAGSMTAPRGFASSGCRARGLCVHERSDVSPEGRREHFP